MTAFLGRLVMLCVVGAIAVGVAASVAGAAKPARGCTQNYTLDPVNTSDPVQVSIDKNGDGLICNKSVPVGNGNGVDKTTNGVDNTSNASG
jgi:hypothetical protein